MHRPPLTEDQKAAAASQAPLVFVESAPGSGKTTVAAERFGVLRHVRHVEDQRGVIAVSFARSAVTELRGRAINRWGGRTVSRPNRVTTMDGLHRVIVEFLLRTGRIRWPGGIVTPSLIDSWARQRGATRIRADGPRNQRWEFALKDDLLAIEYRVVGTPCWGMLYAKRADYVASLVDGVCTHDEIRQIVGLALGRVNLRNAIDEFLSRSIKHLIVDEAFDLNGLDALLVRRAVESGVGVTLVGDPWQAMYEWRGARPDLVHQLLSDYPFETLPMAESFRFQSLETKKLAADLRQGLGVRLPVAVEAPDVVLASEWSHLLDVGPDVVPLSFGQLDCQTDASIALVLDEVTRARLNTNALSVTEALRCLRRDELAVDLTKVLALLRDNSVPLETVMDELRIATKIGGARRPSLPAARRASRIHRLGLLRSWLTVNERYVAGLSFHQAKGREWPRVDVALDRSARRSIDAGLDNKNEQHRKLYVALTRASESTCLRRI